MNRLPSLNHAAEGGSWARPLRAALPELGKCLWYTEHRSCPPRAILESKQNSEIGLADAHRVLQHRAEDRLQFAGRAANHTEDLGCRRLLLQGLAELARARLHLFEQPRVLNRDHRLVGESGEQIDLILGERFDLRTRQEQSTDRSTLPQQGNSQDGTKAP